MVDHSGGDRICNEKNENDKVDCENLMLTEIPKIVDEG